MVTVLKLGGSVVTDKGTPETVDEAALGAAAEAIADAAPPDLVLVHGGGSFGHHHADRHGLTSTAGTRDAAAVADVHDAMTALNRGVVDALHGEGVGAVAVRPLSAAVRTGGAGGEATLEVFDEQIETMLGEGFTPVLHGDVVAHAGEGATILSGDDLVVELARGLDADRVGLCSAVPGVLDGDDEVIDRIAAFDDVAAVLGESDATDVTGGMAAKVRTLLELEVPAHVFGPADLGPFLCGDRPGTEIHRRE